MTLRTRMAATGIGYAGIDGPWWLPAAEPFALPAPTAAELRQIAGAVFALFDAVDALYGMAAGAACGLDTLLEHRVPAGLLRHTGGGPVLGVRPDFQLVREGGGYRLVATELEICPSAQGFAHAMQLGYGLAPELARAYVAMLGGRELLVICASAWSEFLFDQLAFCRALAAAGARARVLCDLPLATLDDTIRRGLRWQPPLFGVRQLPPGWDPDLPGRIARHGLAPFLGPPPAAWPTTVGDALIFRFGYLTCFAPELLAQLRQWEAGGATWLNPPRFYLDSKTVLAALRLPTVRARIAADSAETLAILDRCIPETMLLDERSAARVLRERSDWVLKYAGFDQGEAAWGGRSLQLGASHSEAEWAELVGRALGYPWPVVAQRATPSAQLAVAYVDTQGQQQILHGTTRLRAFMLRNSAPGCYGVHLTVAGSANVAEATDAVQAPVLNGA